MGPLLPPCLTSGGQEEHCSGETCIEEAKTRVERGGLASSPFGAPQEERVSVLGRLPTCPYSFEDCGLPCFLQTVGIPI